MLTCIYAVLLALGTACAATNHCEIPIGLKDREHYRLQWPLVFDKTGSKLYAAETNTAGVNQISIDDGTEVLLSCGPNYLKKFYKTEVLSAKCNGATGNFTVSAKNANVVEGTEMSITDLTCDLRVIEEVLLDTIQSCKQPNSYSSFGYVDPLEQLTIVLGDACYDTAAGVTFWAHLKLGPSVSSSYLRKAEKSFLSSHQHPDGRYKIDLFRGLHFDEIYERIRTQLNTHTPPALKISSFINELLLSNAQLQAVKKLGWNYVVIDEELRVLDTVKQDIQALSKKFELELYVGSHGVQTLHGANGEKMELYLHSASMDGATKKTPQRFPVPDLVWLLVRHEGKSIVFGIFNNAAISQQQVSARGLCQSVCDRVSWLSETKKLNTLELAPLICCSYDEMARSVKELPTLEGINEKLY